MIDQLSYPLRWQLLVRASLSERELLEVERDRIIAMFPGLDHDETVELLEEARRARYAGQLEREQQIIAALIEADQSNQGM